MKFGMILAIASAAVYGQVKPVEGDFLARDFRFHNGKTLPSLRIHYATLGVSNGGNAVLILHGTGGSHKQFLTDHFAGELFGAGQPLDAAKYFIVLPDALGHGGSSKPSDALRWDFPHYTYGDMVDAQYRLLTEGLGVKRLRLVMGTSMGGMQTWIWGERHPDLADALMPLASLPVEIAGRNRFFRRMMLDALADGSEAGLRSAIYTLMVMTSSPLQIQKQAPTREKADALFDETFRKRIENVNAVDFYYEVDASRDYNPQPELDRITAPLTAINSADDEVNPPELGIMEREIARVKRGKYVLIPITAESHGHGTHSYPALWKHELVELLRKSEQR